MTTDTIERLKQQIVEKLEAGGDVSKLSQQLAQERAKEVAQSEVEELKKIADQRLKWQKEAGEIKAKVAKQDEAIDRLLALRDTLVGKLQPLLEPVKELAKMGSINRDGSGEIFEQFHDGFQFGEAVKNIPKGYLPEGFGCPILELAPGTDPSYEKTAEAAYYFTAALGILSNLRKGVMTAILKSIDDGVGRETENTEVELNCRVCSHEKAAEINKALQDGRSLRDLETEFTVPRSTLSRHRNKCLNLGAIKVHD